MKKFFIVSVLIIVAFIVLTLSSPNFYLNFHQKIDLSWLSLIIAHKPEIRTKGLSGLNHLDENQAMLFVFDRPDRYEIWMKDMKFSIDIIWLDKNFMITHIEKNISPDTYPETFFPPRESLYVLEVNAGFSDKNGLSVGKILNFNTFQ